MDRNATLAVSSVWGKIHSNCKLSGILHLLFPRFAFTPCPLGTPDLLLSFTNAQTLTNCSFHPCVRYAPIWNLLSRVLIILIPRLQRWTRDKHLSFVPPDGKFILMEYNYTPSGLHNVAVPFALKPSIKCEDNGGELFSWKHGVMKEHLIKPFFRKNRSISDVAAYNQGTWECDSRTLPGWRHDYCRMYREQQRFLELWSTYTGDLFLHYHPFELLKLILVACRFSTGI